MTPRKKILVAPKAEFDAQAPLFRLLSRLYPADFAADSLDSAEGDGTIVWAKSNTEVREVTARNLPALVVAPPQRPRIPVPHGRVRFGSGFWLERCFRHQTLNEDGIREFGPLTLANGEEPVCYLNGRPYWTSRQEGSTRVCTVALGPPYLTEAHTLYHHFNRRTWLRLLPFLHFVKRLTAADDWSPPPLRACVMFDDPNLHWDTYGHIDFRSLAAHAETCNYHAAFAMIPADAWYVRPRTAQLFREQASRLSLLIHGNDHTPAEFGNGGTMDEHARALAQALRRVDRFERRSGIAVSRVMAPPHGAFRADAGDPMLRLGYEAVCVSRSSLKNWNEDRRWPQSFGHDMVEFLGEGFPVIPRQAMGPGQEDSYRLAAFLDQPIIPHGHHGDCADGLELITRVADAINGIGAVTWSDMTTLSRTNYQTRRLGDTLHVRMLSRRVTLPAPDPGIRSLVAERPWLPEDNPVREALICRQGGEVSDASVAARVSDDIPLHGPGAITLNSPTPRPIDPRYVEPPRRRVWSVVRRVLSESRDRLAPFTPIRARRGA